MLHSLPYKVPGRSILPCVALTTLCLLATINGCGDSDDSGVEPVADAAADAALQLPDARAEVDGSVAVDASMPNLDAGLDAAPVVNDASDLGDAADAEATDAGEAGSGLECDVLAQTGCDASEKCALVNERADATAPITGQLVQCVDDSNPLPEGAVCDVMAEVDPCGPGMKCNRSAVLGDPTCARFCDVEGPACSSPTARCLTRDRFGDVPAVLPANIGVCTEPCSVFETTECTCTPLFQDGDGVCFGGLADPEEGEFCDDAQPYCSAGLGCYGFAIDDAGTVVEYRCYQYCNLANPCTGDSLCTPVQEGSNLGICVNP